jgi:hypothetical protein
MSDDQEGDDLVRKLEELAKKKEAEPAPELTTMLSSASLV